MHQVDQTADGEPDGRDARHQHRHHERLDEEVVAPPLERPPPKTVPDEDHQEHDPELVDDAVEEEPPRYRPVAAGVLGGDADELGVVAAQRLL